jgi:hypothetical protein
MAWDLRQDMPRLRKAVDSAPSIFNQRPWELEFPASDRVDLYSVPDAALGRRLPREMVISCGAALYNLRLAIEVAGRAPSVWLFPGTDRESGLLTTVTERRTLLASVEVAAARPTPPTDAEQELYEALWLRRTDGGPYAYMPVPIPILVEMEIAAAHEHGWLRIIPKAESRRLLRAAIRASSELESTMSGIGGGPDAAHGPTPADEKAPRTLPDFWLPGHLERFERYPQLMGLSTDDDRPLDWLRAGEALQHALLTGTRYSMSAPGGRSAGYRTRLQYGPLDLNRIRPRPAVPAGYAVEASFLTQPFELADLRGRSRFWPWRTNYTEIPQVVVHVGYAPAMPGAGPDSPAAASLPRPVADQNEPVQEPADSGSAADTGRSVAGEL